MTSVTIHDIALSFAGNPILHDINLVVDSGQYVVLLGPSGCGKTTLLRTIAGLQTPDRGRVLLDGQAIDNVPPRRRGIAMVPQHGGLYPHLTVEQSIRASLRQVADRRTVDDRVTQAIRLAKISAIVNRYPDRLSGGEQRRGAIAKAIARQASVRLLDEPLAALDVPLRQALQDDLLRWHGEQPGTTIHVTHDGLEAMRIADRIAVMENGEIIQHDSPTAIYRRPASVTVAQSIGSPSINLLEGRIRAGKIELSDPAAEVVGCPAKHWPAAEIWLGIRPDRLRPTLSGAVQDQHFCFDGLLNRVDVVGPNIELHVSSKRSKLHAIVDQSVSELGQGLHLQAPLGDCHVFRRDTGRRIEFD